jgi:putative flippase GtrA
MKQDFYKFILTGVGSNLVNFAFYFIFFSLGISVFFSSIYGYSMGLIVSYYLSKNWVFKTRKTSHSNTLGIIKFVIVYSIGGLGMSFIISWLVNTTNFDYRMSWLAGAVFAVINNFFGLKYFVFHEEHK